jgi:hypothetical protein
MKKLLLIAIVFCATSAFATSEIFIKIDGFAGKSTDPEHPGWIVPSSFGWGSGGGGPVASQFQQHSATFTLVNPPAGWESQFMKSAASGMPLGTVLVDIGLMRATLDHAIVASAKPGFDMGTHWPLLTVTLNFTGNTTTTKPKPHPGAAGPPIGEVTSTSNASVGSNVAVSPNAQVFVDGVPGERFDLLGVSLQGANAATLTLREPSRGLFQSAVGTENELRIVSRNLSFVFKKVTIVYSKQSSDRTVTTGLRFASYVGPAGGLRQ